MRQIKFEFMREQYKQHIYQEPEKNMDKKYVYHFNKHSEAYLEHQCVAFNPILKFQEQFASILGNKATSLNILAQLGYNVPAGFTLISEFQNLSEEDQRNILLKEYRKLCEASGRTKVSVRSGAKISMPGIMETVLNVEGIDDIWTAVKEVFASWNSDKAKTYRNLQSISETLGTSVTIQVMVHGDKNQNSATGVVFSRDPIEGRKTLTGDFLIQATGPEIVDGKRPPLGISKMVEMMPINLIKIDIAAKQLEKMFKFPQDIEFTIEDGELFFLQTRNAKLTPEASVTIAYDLFVEGCIDRARALEIADKLYMKNSQKMKLVPTNARVVAKGTPVSPGIASGYTVTNLKELEYIKGQGFAPILLRTETTSDDVDLMSKAAAIITRIGGITSHASTVARILKKPCIVGVGDVEIPNTKLEFDGGQGMIYEGFCDLKLTCDDDYVRLLKILEELK
jgi:pyruvate,orthophosphate dikinase